MEVTDTPFHRHAIISEEMNWSIIACDTILSNEFIEAQQRELPITLE
jgi:hypothetical protein